jgi:glutamate synthase domain-containing protein 2
MKRSALLPPLIWVLSIIFVNLPSASAAPAGPGCDPLEIETVEGQKDWQRVEEVVAGSMEQSNGDWATCLRCMFHALNENLTYGAYRMLTKIYVDAKIYVGAPIYRNGLWAVKSMLAMMGPPIRAWFLRAEGEKQDVIEHEMMDAFDKGSFKRGHSFPNFIGEVRPARVLEGGLEQRMTSIEQQTMKIGREGVKPVNISAGLHTSAISFPAVSAQTKAIWLYVHAKLAASGTRLLFNTGEGGPGFELAFITGDRETIRREVVDYNVNTGTMERNSLKQAMIEADVDRIFAMRDRLFRDLPPGSIERIQVVAQFGGALNGIRDLKTGGIDWGLLEKISQHQNYSMTQIKLAQAAKSKAQNSKIGYLAAYLRSVIAFEPVKAPEVPPGFESAESTAENIKRIRQITGKPVSLKMVVGSVPEFYQYLEKLVQLGGLPDHIQVDGSTATQSSGSGSFSRGQGATLDIHPTVLITHGILQKLGVRDQVVLEATGGARIPENAMDLMASGADMVSSARAWMTGAGCKKMRACNESKGCLYGFAAPSNSIMAEAMPVALLAKKGTDFWTGWHEIQREQLANSGADGWVGYWRNHGIYAGAPRLLKRQDMSDFGLKPLMLSYEIDNLMPYFEGVMTRQEVSQHIFGGRVF